MVIVRLPTRLALAVLLLQAIPPVLAGNRWDCEPVADAVWECTGKIMPAQAIQPTPGSRKDSTADGNAAPPTATTVMPVGNEETAPVAATPAITGTQTPAGPSMDAAPDTATHPPAATTPATPEPDAPVTSETATTDDEPSPAPAFTEADTTALAAAAASQRWAHCPPAPLPEHLANIDDSGNIDLRADKVQASKEQVFTLSGDAVVRYGEQQLNASNITYKRASGEIEATNGVRLAGPDIVISADRAFIDTQTESGRLENINYSVPGQYARGSAQVLGYQGSAHQHLEDASYTACPPGNLDWQLTAKEIELDQTDGTGVARNAKITFKNIPILYTPYISFPLDDRRKSGLLFPKVGTTDETGLDISVPWYWNISPQRDLTLTPRLMSDRGVMLGGEFRYLNRRSAGTIKAEYLPSDKEFADEDRSLVVVNHQGNPVPRLSTRIVASNVSDTSYFDDLGSSLVETSQTSLERTAQATWHSDSWEAGIMVQDFQNIDTTLASVDRPYKQLPKVAFNTTREKRFFGVQTGAQAELNNFTHGNNTRVTGSRLDVMPRFSLPVQRPGWYIDPAVAIRHTAYHLDDVSAGKPTDPTRTLPVATLDMGSFFERNGQWSDIPYIQTLEPRLFYLYVPHKDQDDLPIFDTDNFDQNFWSLFRENRFSGPDRMGDANQLAIALTTRIINPASGRQMMSASLGSLLYFRDRDVTLPGETVATDDSSDLIGEVSIALSRRWNARGEAHWNPHTSTAVRNGLGLQYLAGPRRRANIGYRFRDGIQEQVDFSFLWPVSRAWHAVGRWYYDLDNNETIEALAGLGYERCCWGLQVLGRSYINKDNNRRNNAVFIQLELKGLGKLGSNIDSALERGILGYQSVN